MSSNYPKSGPNNVPAYQMSGIPFVTSSIANEVPGPDDNSSSKPVKVSFPFVTKWITVRNTGINELRVGFSADGTVAPVDEFLASHALVGDSFCGRNYFLIPSASVDTHGNNIYTQETIQTFEVRCKEIYFLSDATAVNSPGAAQSTSFSLMAGLTPIEAQEFPALTASNGFTGVG